MKGMNLLVVSYNIYTLLWLRQFGQKMIRSVRRATRPLAGI